MRGYATVSAGARAGGMYMLLLDCRSHPCLQKSKHLESIAQATETGFTVERPTIAGSSGHPAACELPGGVRRVEVGSEDQRARWMRGVRKHVSWIRGGTTHPKGLAWRDPFLATEVIGRERTPVEYLAEV